MSLLPLYLRVLALLAALFAGYLAGRRVERAQMAERVGRRLGRMAVLACGLLLALPGASCRQPDSGPRVPDIAGPCQPPPRPPLRLAGVVVTETGEVVGGIYR